jgi:hypothetical protein
MAGHGERRNAYKILDTQHDRDRQLGRPRCICGSLQEVLARIKIRHHIFRIQVTNITSEPTSSIQTLLARPCHKRCETKEKMYRRD